jgi:hypothetical protein
VGLAELQDREVGDGTTSVVIIEAELLKVCGSQLQLQLWIKHRALQRKDEHYPSAQYLTCLFILLVSAASQQPHQKQDPPHINNKWISCKSDV